MKNIQTFNFNNINCTIFNDKNSLTVEFNIWGLGERAALIKEIKLFSRDRNHEIGVDLRGKLKDFGYDLIYPAKITFGNIAHFSIKKL